ncbi:hypothetical protein QVD99_008665 [Batrachochytrium dendrobatidis]|nr:hypothetical protein O5D80_001243 [Batrachochytrium dendrobatidis]KAK5664606.1 hypothetical protein QVD99_008665 [Batrachochytrium dendrobatidis]
MSNDHPPPAQNHQQYGPRLGRKLPLPPILGLPRNLTSPAPHSSAIALDNNAHHFWAWH